MKKMVKKKAVRKAGKKKTAKAVKKEKTSEKEIGEVSTFFSHVSVIAIKLMAPLSLGDRIHIKGHTTDFKQKVSSMQIDNEKVERAGKGNHVGIKVIDRARPNDKVFLVK